MKKKIVYEQPLNERIRNLLRLEHLFEGVTYRLKGPASWDSREVLTHLTEVVELMGRTDFRGELIRDLEHYSQILERWYRTPGVDEQVINRLKESAGNLLNQLRAQTNQKELTTPLADHYLINLLKQRSAIVGGTSGCDLPFYHCWLQKNPKQRQNEINDWLAPLMPLRDAVEFDLYMIRNNATISQEIANEGFYQSKLDSHVDYQLIRVMLPTDNVYYPEISGGKQRFTIRFFEQEQAENRPVQATQDIQFELCCCMI